MKIVDFLGGKIFFFINICYIVVFKKNTYNFGSTMEENTLYIIFIKSTDRSVRKSWKYTKIFKGGISLNHMWEFIWDMMKALPASHPNGSTPRSPTYSLKQMRRSPLWSVFLYPLWHDFWRKKRWIILSKAFLKCC